MTVPLPDNLADDDLSLLYLAQELPPADYARFTERLASDVALRQRVERLTADQAMVFGVLDRVDAAVALPSPFYAARQIGEATQTKVQTAVPVVPRWRQIGRWMIVPTAAAAVLALGLAGWYLSIPPDEDATPLTSDDDNTPSLLALRPGAGGDPSTMSDDQILAQFDPIVVEPPADTERQAAALLYLDKALPTEKGLP